MEVNGQIIKELWHVPTGSLLSGGSDEPTFSGDIRKLSYVYKNICTTGGSTSNSFGYTCFPFEINNKIYYFGLGINNNNNKLSILTTDGNIICSFLKDDNISFDNPIINKNKFYLPTHKKNSPSTIGTTKFEFNNGELVKIGMYLTEKRSDSQIIRKSAFDDGSDYDILIVTGGSSYNPPKITIFDDNFNVVSDKTNDNFSYYNITNIYFIPQKNIFLVVDSNYISIYSTSIELISRKNYTLYSYKRAIAFKNDNIYICQTKRDSNNYYYIQSTKININTFDTITKENDMKIFSSKAYLDKETISIYNDNYIFLMLYVSDSYIESRLYDLDLTKDGYGYKVPKNEKFINLPKTINDNVKYVYDRPEYYFLDVKNYFKFVDLEN